MPGKAPLRNRAKFADDDPLRDLHVPKKDRLEDDGWVGGEGDAVDAVTGERDDDFDWAEVRSRGGVVPKDRLQ